MAEYLVKTFIYESTVYIDKVTDKFERDLNSYLKSIRSNFEEHSVVSVSHDYKEDEITFVVVIKRVDY